MAGIFDLAAYAAKARELMGEGAVLLQNDDRALPIAEGSKVALFGRSQFNYYKSGTGSGGMVNTSYVTGVREAIEQSKAFELNASVKDTYDAWIIEHPYFAGNGWGQEPWFQEEMPLTEELVEKAAAESDYAIVLIGRTAGEDQDNKAEAGSYYLTDLEKDMLEKVTKAFDRTIVLLNVGNIIDMNWVEEYDPSAVMYIWQGGQEGGNGVLDLLTGKVSPSGKLTDTIAYAIEDYPSFANFGDEKENIYAEDIYVGYRYFETFAPEKVQYPFGYGLSYTSFEVEAGDPEIEETLTMTVEEIEVMEAAAEEAHITLEEELDEDFGFDLSPASIITIPARVTNTGDCAGKEVIQVYVKAPQGKLGKPALSLVGYTKTCLLAPGESEEVSVPVRPYNFASYDDSGVTGYKSAYVLEAGSYEFYVGSSCRDLILAMEMDIEETLVVSQQEEALAPVKAFQVLKPVMAEDGTITRSYVDASLRTINPEDRRKANMPEEIPYTGDLGYKLQDVWDEKVSLDAFVGQLSDEDLIAITRGEGMSSPLVTPGTGGAYAGVTKRLQEFGIPACCCSDGPSGIRMDCGTKAFAMPNGTCMAATFNDALIEEMYQFEGLELRKNKIENLLGPGMNLHRFPLNGRNFEYFSEDPLVSGKMAAAQLRGMHKYGVTGTIKHFACNDQEFHRNDVSGVLTERAMRELYLKSFEIAVKEGEADSVMSTYGPINGQWTAGCYDLLTTVLRGEWGFSGVVMTDWWAQINAIDVEGEEAPSRNNMAAMIRAQNDLYMVHMNAETNSNKDNLAEALAAGKVTRAELQRCAKNICWMALDTQAINRLNGVTTELDVELAKCHEDDGVSPDDVKLYYMDTEVEVPAESIKTDRGTMNVIHIIGQRPSMNKLVLEARVVTESEVAQVPLSIFKDTGVVKMVTLTGADTEWQTIEADLGLAFMPNYFVKLYFGQSGMEIRNVKVIQTMDATELVAKIRAEM